VENSLMTVTETAEYLCISKWTLYRWIKEKNMPVYKLGGLDRFKRSEIDCWLMLFKRS